MTTPNQTSPDGAYVLGGGTARFGQDMTEDLATSIFGGPVVQLDNPLEQLANTLALLPPEASKPFKNIIPGATDADFESHDTGIDLIVGSLVSGFSKSQQKKELTELSAGLASLKADITGNNNSGKNFTVTVSEYAPDVPSVFTQIVNDGAGDLTNDGDTLEFPNVTGREAYLYNVEPLLTRFPEVSLIVPRQAGLYFGSYGQRSLYWIFRSNAAGTTFTFAVLIGNLLSVGFYNAGVITLFGSGDGTGSVQVSINPASYMTARGGTIADERIFQFLCNNKVAATFTDSSAVSTINDTDCWTGFGIENSADDLINRVPNISHFIANDNAPQAVVGSGGSMSRISTGTVNISSGENVLPTSFFGSPGVLTADITRSLPNGSYEVSADDWYNLSAHIAVGSSWPSHFQLVLFVDTVAYEYAGNDQSWGSNVLGGTIKPEGVGATWNSVYLTAGQVVQLGYSSSDSILGALTGTADGAQTYFKISRGK